MNNGVTFGNKNSVTDWDLLMTAKTIGEAVPKTKYVEIPGRDGALDFTESTGEVKYSDRTLTFRFELLNPSSFWETQRKIVNHLNGRKLKIILDQDPNYYFYGRCKVANDNLIKNLGEFNIECICDPYKYKKEETVITQNVSVGNSYNYINDRKSVIPTLTLSSAMTIEFEGNSYSLGAGSQKVLDIQFKEGTNTIEIISGSGTLTVAYQEASL